MGPVGPKCLYQQHTGAMTDAQKSTEKKLHCCLIQLLAFSKHAINSLNPGGKLHCADELVTRELSGGREGGKPCKDCSSTTKPSISCEAAQLLLLLSPLFRVGECRARDTTLVALASPR